MEIRIHNEGLTGYYLRDKFDGEFEETGLVFEQPDPDVRETIKIVYNCTEELESRLSYILGRLTDR